MTYDGYGRLKTRHTPQQDTDKVTTYDYYKDDTLQKVTDARGAGATYSYNNRQLVTAISYGAPTGIDAAPDVAFGYDEAGNRLWMTDGLGRVDYEYDTLSRLKSETRKFNDFTQSFKLTYSWNLAGELTSVTDQFGTKTSYGFDSVGRQVNIGGEGLGVSNYASHIKYRAWGAMKSGVYGDGISLNLDYNGRLQVSAFKGLLDSSIKMGHEYQYYNDGRVRYSHDLTDGKFDRSYNYDHMGRLTEARSRNEANGGTTADGPYHQTFGYDVWGYITKRSLRHWSRTYDDDLYTYVNDRNPNWQYDEDGRILKEPSVVNKKTEVQNHFDAAGQNDYLQTKLWQSAHLFTDTLERSFDGDGQVLKEKKTEAEALVSSSTTYTYYLRSTVMKGQVIATLNASGEKVWSYIYDAQGQVVASSRHVTEGQPAVTWQHRAPSGSTRWSRSSASISDPYRTELDPVGANVGISDPYTGSSGGNETASFHGSDMLSRFADPVVFDFGCTLDFVETDCSSALRAVNSGGAVQCPNNDCNPRRMDVHLDSHLIASFLTLPFQAFADGTSGFFPVGVRYVGDGIIFDGEKVEFGPGEGIDGINYFEQPQKSAGKQCDERLAGIFGGDGAVFATDHDPSTLKYGAGRDRLSSATEDPRQGGAHIYASATGAGVANAYVYTPKGYLGQAEGSYTAHKDTDFPELQNFHQFTYRPGSLKGFGYSGGLMISFIHTGPTDASGKPSPANTSITNAAGSVGVGIIGNFGGKVNVGGSDESCVHTHIIFYRAGARGNRLGRIDPRTVFCHDLGF